MHIIKELISFSYDIFNIISIIATIEFIFVKVKFIIEHKKLIYIMIILVIEYILMVLRLKSINKNLYEPDYEIVKYIDKKFMV